MTAEQQRLVVENMALVPYMVNKHFSRITYFEKEDMYSIGYIAMCRAARDFDPKRGWKYATLAGKYIHTTICNEIQKATRECRDARNCATTFDQLAPAPSEKEPETLGGLIPSVDSVETITGAKFLIEWLDGQNGNDGRIIRLHIAGYTQREISSRVGISQSRVSKRIRMIEQRIREYYAIAM